MGNISGTIILGIYETGRPQIMGWLFLCQDRDGGASFQIIGLKSLLSLWIHRHIFEMWSIDDVEQ